MSLRARILWLVLLASLLPVLAMVWALLENRNHTLEQVRTQLGIRTAAIASDLDDKISGTAQLLFGLARVPVLDGDDLAACSTFLADVLHVRPARVDGASRLFTESQYLTICRQLQAHVGAMAELYGEVTA